MTTNDSILVQPWGQSLEGEVQLYTLSQGGLRVSISTYGGTVTSLRVPDRTGQIGEIALGYDGLAGYLADSCYMGCLVGRVANRTSNARIKLSGQAFELDRNHGMHHLHGGATGFHARIWQAFPGEVGCDPCLRLTLTSEDGDQGYPGRLHVTVTYILTCEELRVVYAAEADAPTPVNLTSHIYFNLAGPLAGDCLDQELLLASSQIQEGDREQIPTGALLPVAGTVLDFCKSKPLGRDMDTSHPLLATEKGYDHSFVLDKGVGPVATLYDPASGRRMQMHTDSPCLHLYTGNYVPDGLVGRAGERYGPHQGVCLEAQEFVDAVNRSEFPSIILCPGKRYERSTRYGFSLA